MKFTTIRIEGPILSSDVLDKIEQGDIGFQSPKDFNLDSKTKVKDEIARSWADAQELWRIFKHQRERVQFGLTGTSETRKYWIIPLLGLFGYDAELSKAETVQGKSYAISHGVLKMDGFPIHIMGFNDSLDKKRSDSGPRMSPHALVQEYINLTEHLYAIVTNGLQLRLLRDSSRLIKLSFLEFDLETMMEEEHYADFAVMFRLLHSSRMPVKMEAGPESIIEQYHQDALDSGSRIRDGLSLAVKRSIHMLANGFLSHPRNIKINQEIELGNLKSEQFYQALLRLIYRLLFLMVIEERNLIFSKDADKIKRDIYYKYYSVNSLRNLCEKSYIADERFSDSWKSLKNTFRLFVDAEQGSYLGIKPLAGDLFGYDVIGILNECELDNKVLLESIKNLNVFVHERTKQIMRVNYSSLNVEEFGSVYEGLLEYDPNLRLENGRYKFSFQEGDKRSSSGSHYTPDELVKPLITHSLDYIIEDKLKEDDKEKALLSIRVCDVACGSGHILLSAARRIGIELAKIITKEDQPSPEASRKAIRQVIQSCIYGVDKNPLAVELCKVALWLEAHNPGEPLNFLDHHIKCGDAIVGLAHKEELEKGIADEAFKQMPEDDKEFRASLAKSNKNDKKNNKNLKWNFDQKINAPVLNISNLFRKLEDLPENTPEQIEHKHKVYERFITDTNLRNLRILADMQVVQFFIPKTQDNKDTIVTDAEYRDYLSGAKPLRGAKVDKAIAVAQEKRVFHWFLEFPEIFIKGGFDCILGNPPYLGAQKITVNFAERYHEFIRNYFGTKGITDLVVYFLIRIFHIAKATQGRLGLISTNSIYQGDSRKSGLVRLIEDGATINFAKKSIKWPGKANLDVSLFAIEKNAIRKNKAFLDNEEVDKINSFFDNAGNSEEVYKLYTNKGKAFVGCYVLGDGFLLSDDEAMKIFKINSVYKDVVKPILNGDDLNNSPSQSPSKYCINFYDWSLDKVKNFDLCYRILLQKVKPIRASHKRKAYKERWWQYAEKRPGLYEAIRHFPATLVTAKTAKHFGFCFVNTNYVLDQNLSIIASNSYYDFSVLQSSLHDIWVRTFGTTLGQASRYNPATAFENYPFPNNPEVSLKKETMDIGKKYYQFREQLMQEMNIGITKLYNLFHLKSLNVMQIEKGCKLSMEICEKAVTDIIQLREFHKKMDIAVIEAYGWSDITPAHNIYEVDFLPENDRIRYTISPEARKEILKRLLKLNHEIHEKEVAEGAFEKKKPKNKKSDDKLAQQGQKSFL
ncbi:MAG: SAM-dependent methyltransferase [Candidatus Omnitrophica bacterium]|nr:SAM-dependent methyltransferase [Candidatus Omnitrophota bacterium]